MLSLVNWNPDFSNLSIQLEPDVVKLDLIHSCEHWNFNPVLQRNDFVAKYPKPVILNSWFLVHFRFPLKFKIPLNCTLPDTYENLEFVIKQEHFAVRVSMDDDLVILWEKLASHFEIKVKTKLKDLLYKVVC